MHTTQPTQPTQRPTDIRSDQNYSSGPIMRRENVVVPRESKPGFKTTEFWVMLAMVAGTLVATYADSDSLAREDGWRFAAFVVAAYIVSRGLAKIGTADRKVQDRD